jgi:hypothetical protein
MGFFFYVTDFWYWRWKGIFETIAVHLDRKALKSYYINFFFFAFIFYPAWKKVSEIVEPSVDA